MNAIIASASPRIVEDSRIQRSPALVSKPVADNAAHRVEPSPESDLPSPAAKRGSALRRVILGSFILAAGIGVAKLGHDWWTVGRYMEGTDDAYIAGDITVISPKVAGFIADVAVGDNQPVHAGDLLIKLDDRDYQAALAKAGAVVANQQAALANLDATRYLQESLVTEAEAEIASTEAEIVRARDDQARYRHLSETSAVSVQSFQQADSDYKRAVAAGQRSHAHLAATQRQLEVIAAQKQQAQAALDQAVAERELARLNVSYTELHAPVDGIVGNRSAHAGGYASTGSQLISLVPSRGLWIDANFKESQLERIRAGSLATVKIDSISGHVFKGHVASVAPATGAQFSVLPPENATGNFTKIVQRITVRIVLDNEEAMAAHLRPGLSVKAEVDGRSSGKASL